MTTSIYVLIDPRTNEVRYVGKTVNPVRRLWSHINDKTVCHRTNWIKSLLGLGLKPKMSIIESMDSSDDSLWQERERYWVEYYSKTCRLTNLDSGGVSGKIASAETRAKLSAAFKGRPKSPEHVAKVASAHRGRKCSPESIARMSKPRINWSAESRSRFGAARKGKKLSAGTKMKMSVAHKGRKKSPEWRRKIGDAHIGMKRSAKARSNMSSARKLFLSKKQNQHV